MTARLLGLSHRCCLRRHQLITQQETSVAIRRCRPLRSMAYSGARNTAIQLTQQEEELFGILLKTLEHQHLKTVLRCAGGWVRDKLLGKDSHDIDIAIDNKLGGEFAEHVNTYLSSQDLETRRVRHAMPMQCPFPPLQGSTNSAESPATLTILCMKPGLQTLTLPQGSSTQHALLNVMLLSCVSSPCRLL